MLVPNNLTPMKTRIQVISDRFLLLPCLHQIPMQIRDQGLLQFTKTTRDNQDNHKKRVQIEEVLYQIKASNLPQTL